jgi:DNA polymerase III subunit epsilon
MNLKLKKPLAFFDLETTGINIINDRIVEISIVKVLPSGIKEIKTLKVNPGMPIPKESSMIHGIYDEDVADKPHFKEVAKTLSNFIEGCDLAGFNIARFDVPVLVEEFLRAGVEFDLDGRHIVDAQKIFHLMEPRTLSAAYKFYCKKDLENAHSAEADTMATFDVLDAQIALYDGVVLKDQKGVETTPVLNDMATLHKLTLSNNVDLAGRMQYNGSGVAVFNFGKHKDRPVIEILDKEPSYYEWIMKGEFPLDTKRRLTEIKLKKLSR